MTVSLTAGFIPLVDMAPLAIAREIGFAEEEGLELQLVRAPSRSTLRDMLALGQIEAAHMLSPVPVAAALGLGGAAAQLDALSVLSVNGNVIGVSRDLAARMREGGHGFDFSDATSAGRALIGATQDRLRLGVPFPFSMHAELLYLWLGALGVSTPQDLQVKTVPPPLMAQALAAGEVDAFCVGEPWGSITVETGVGELLLPGAAIWRFSPEKVLAVRHDWANSESDLTRRLMRAVWRASRWLGSRDNRIMASEILARPEYVNVSAEVLERALTGQIMISPRGEMRKRADFLNFHAGAANFPWRSQAAFVANRLAARTGMDRVQAMDAGRMVFRTDLYRRNLADIGAEMPGASEKLEGAISHRTAVASTSGKLILEPDAFFDGTIFDPTAD